MLNTAASLRAPLVKREIFDPVNPHHLASLDVFLKTGNWGNVQFFAELPFVEVPITVLTKYALWCRAVQPETATERAARMAAKNLVVPTRESKEDHKTRLDTASAKIKADLTQ